MKLYTVQKTRKLEEMDEKEVIDLCSESKTISSEQCKGKESKKQENCNMEESKTIARLESENWPEKYSQAEETEKYKIAMMCWENSECSLVEEPNKQTDDQEGRAVDEM